MERELSGFDQPLDLKDRLPYAEPVVRGVAVKFGVKCKLLFVEDCAREIGVDQNVHVEVHEGEDAVCEARGRVDVAVELEEESGRRLKAEDAVPAVGPEKFCAEGAGLYGADEGVAYLGFEDGFEDDEGTFQSRDSRGPATAYAPVVFAGVYKDLLQSSTSVLRAAGESQFDVWG